jgi:hypothetical protein
MKVKRGKKLLNPKNVVKARWVTINNDRKRGEPTERLEVVIPDVRALLASGKTTEEETTFAQFKAELAKGTGRSQDFVQENILRFHGFGETLPARTAAEWFLKTEVLVEGLPVCYMHNPEDVPELVELAPPIPEEDDEDASKPEKKKVGQSAMKRHRTLVRTQVL